MPAITESWNLIVPERLETIDALTEAEPPVVGGCLPLTAPEMELFNYKNRVGSWTEPTAVVFAPAGSRAKMVMATGTYGSAGVCCCSTPPRPSPKVRGLP